MRFFLQFNTNKAIFKNVVNQTFDKMATFNWLVTNTLQNIFIQPKEIQFNTQNDELGVKYPFKDTQGYNKYLELPSVFPTSTSTLTSVMRSWMEILLKLILWAFALVLYGARTQLSVQLRVGERGGSSFCLLRSTSIILQGEAVGALSVNPIKGGVHREYLPKNTFMAGLTSGKHKQ